MKYHTLRGMHDILPEEAEKIHRVEVIARRVFKNFNYSEIKIPTLEEASLFLRTIGETSDIVEKQMYIFKDKGDRTVALRPEGTAGVVRAFIEHNLDGRAAITKLFYCGSMFRYERPQEGRYREFEQIGCEYFGNSTALCDAEVITVAKKILDECGVKQKILINSIGCKKCRPSYTKIITDYASKIKHTLCNDCQRRLAQNPLRVLDCKIDAPKLKDFPKSEEHLCDNCKTHFNQLKNILESQDIDFEIEHRLVRGLDYYTGVVFEIKSDNLASQDTIAAGGRYDGLVEELGGKPTPACGFALGVERLILSSKLSEIPQQKKIFIAITNISFQKNALNLASSLRNKNYTVDGPFAGKSLKSQLNLASKLGFQYVVIFGEEEFKKGEIILKDMNSGEQKRVTTQNIFEKIQGEQDETKISAT